MNCGSHYELYIDRAGEYRWRFVAANGRIVFICSEGYTTSKAALQSLRIAKLSAGAAVIEPKGERGTR